MLLFKFSLINLRPPPTSTLFPYTTLFRSGIDHLGQRRRVDDHDVGHVLGVLDQVLCGRQRELVGHPLSGARSEEHTSELQSRLHLVCRLLLEKKTKMKIA